MQCQINAGIQTIEVKSTDDKVIISIDKKFVDIESEKTYFGVGKKLSEQMGKSKKIAGFQVILLLTCGFKKNLNSKKQYNSNGT